MKRSKQVTGIGWLLVFLLGFLGFWDERKCGGTWI